MDLQPSLHRAHKGKQTIIFFSCLKQNAINTNAAV